MQYCYHLETFKIIYVKTVLSHCITLWKQWIGMEWIHLFCGKSLVIVFIYLVLLFL